MSDALLTNARRLRRTMTDAERRLWSRLRDHQLGVHFRRQVPMERYVLDFLCLPARLVIEVDGGQHADPDLGDKERDAWLRQRGFRILRFWNNEVLENTEGVLERVLDALRDSPPPLPSIEGKGERSRQRARKNASSPPRVPAVGRHTEARRHEL